MKAMKFIRDNWKVGDKVIVWDRLWSTFEEAIIDEVECPNDKMLVRFIAQRLSYDATLLVDRYHYTIRPMPGEIICTIEQLKRQKKPY